MSRLRVGLVILASLSLLSACSSSTPTQAPVTSAVASAPSTPSTTVSSAPASASAAAVQTITSGQLTVAVDQDMPYNGVGTDGKLTGVNGDVITEIATKLGLQINIQQMDFSPGLQAIQSGRVDTMTDCPVDTPQREGVYNLSEGFFYIPLEISQRKAENLNTIEDIKGHTFGTIQGYSEVPLYQAIPWIGKGLKLYPTVDALIQDLLASRLDAFAIGSPTPAYVITQHPEYDLKYVLMAPTPLLPETTAPGVCIFPVNKSNTALVPAINGVLSQMKTNGDLTAIFAKYNMTNPEFVTGVPATSGASPSP
jgi:polar amino acid transport system substrate-binding protein